MSILYSLEVRDQYGNLTTLKVKAGKNLREALLEANFGPYTSFTKKVNCGGNGICATCGVIIVEETTAIHWHDRLAKRFGYPRLSCQINVKQDMKIKIPKKLIWGNRLTKD